MHRTQSILSVALSLLALAAASAQEVSVAPEGWPHTYHPDQFHSWPAGDPRGWLGDVVVGESRTMTYEIASTYIDFSKDPPFIGPPLTIYSVALTDLSPAFDLHVPTYDPEIHAGDFVPVDVTFTPPGLGSLSETLTIVTNDRETAVLELPISGMGVNAPPQPIPAPGAILLGMFGTTMVAWMRRRRTL